jgi:ligand-binding SRPBCC domain-containing protein
MESILATGDPPAGLRRLVRSQIVPLGVDDAFAFFADPLNLEAITPPWLRFRVLTRTVTLGEGALIEYRLRLHRVPVSWRTRIEEWEPGVRFVDRQLEGPFAHWEHLHVFRAVDGGTLIADRVDYRMPLGPLGAVAHAVLTRRDLDRIFDFRRAAVTRLLDSAPPPRRDPRSAPDTPR